MFLKIVEFEMVFYENKEQEILPKLVRLAGIEPTTFAFGGQHSIQLSYKRKQQYDSV